MAKELLKVALKTLCFLLALTLVLASIFVLVFPSKSSSISSKLGFDKFASLCSKIAYEKTEDINDLAVLVENSIVSDSTKYIATYSEKLLADKNFSDFCDFKDGGLTSSSYENFILGNLSIAYAKLDQTHLINSLLFDNGTDYEINDECVYLINYLNLTDVENGELATTMLAKLDEKFMSENSTQEEKKYICLDAFMLATKYDEKLATIWKDRYETLD